MEIASYEWLETDGLGGFAMGNSVLPPSRRYHSILTAPTTPPIGRTTLVNAVESVVEFESGEQFPLSTFRYTPGIIHPDISHTLKSFSSSLWPTWTYEVTPTLSIEASLFMPKGASLTCLCWKMRTKEGAPKATLKIRPLISCRDYHSLHHHNPALSFATKKQKKRLYWCPYGSTEIFALTNGTFHESPQWHYNFHYSDEDARGYDSVEDLASPGYITFSLSETPAVIIFGLARKGEAAITPSESAIDAFTRLEGEEMRRRRALTPQQRAADSYIISRDKGLTIIAGYPWFTDWGRDTFIAIRGLCISTGRLDDACTILSQWTKSLSQGMLPNRFLDRPPAGSVDAEYNSVDASLWFIIAAYDLFNAYGKLGQDLPKKIHAELLVAIELILQGYSQGTRYQIGVESDGLLRAGVPGVQLTWMDAKVGDYVVTPRIGKPVEIQALWLNALRIGALLLKNSSDRWNSLLSRGVQSFSAKFWNEKRQCLYDVIDVDHILNTVDDRIRPNQVYAVGGLPFAVLDDDRGKVLLSTVEKTLLTPMGLRTLAPGERGYAPTYEGNTDKRNFAYHQGTVWPWLLGAFVDGWVRLNGNTEKAKNEARKRFLNPLLASLEGRSDGAHIPEIADAEQPHIARGCPFQAWSLGEVLRIENSVL